jgi:branched-chain amino acid transport system substrate-binding protein
MKQSQFLSLAVASAVAVLCLGALKLIDTQTDTASVLTEVSPPQASSITPSVSSEVPTTTENPIEGKISFGNRILIQNEEVSSSQMAFQSAKGRGVEAMAKEDYSTAVRAFEEAIRLYQNAPETLIYLNNARIGNKKSYTLAIAIPIQEDKADGANVPKEMLRGIAQKQDEINASGGIKGVPLRVLIADDDSDAETAEQIARVLADDDDVLGVIGHFTSDASLAASDIYQEEGLVMISPTSTSVELSTKGNYIFRSLPSDTFNAAALVNYMLGNLKLEKAAIFYNSKSVYSSNLMEVFKKELLVKNGKIVAQFDFSSNDFNTSEAIQEAMVQEAETLILFHNTGVLDQALEVVKANQAKLPMLSGDSGYKPEMLELGEYTENDIFVTVPWNLIGGNEEAPFTRAARQLWKSDVSWRTAMTYDATQALVKALETDPTREGIQKTLADPSFSADGVAETIKFQSNTGDRDGSPQLVTVKRGGNTPSGYSFVLIEPSNN